MSFVSVDLMGGLGNCLFQIAAAYSTSLRDSKTFICQKNVSHGSHKPLDYYLNNIFGKINFGEVNTNSQLYKEPFFHYNEIPKTNDNLILNGYFQSEKYFINYRNEILELFAINNEVNHKLQTKYQKLLNKKTCSIHVRRGDYIRLNDFHTVQPIDYYEKSFNLIGEDYEYLIFSDDIEWCKNNFDFIKNKHFIEGDADYENLYLMSMCEHNIIANSSFSWWGAWMNMNENKKVISPKNWFGNKNKHLDTQDIYPKNWVLI
jgi:hypothetical protein